MAIPSEFMITSMAYEFSAVCGSCVLQCVMRERMCRNFGLTVLRKRPSKRLKPDTKGCFT
ncbi:hypothetical protein T11_1615 [Trichinella zimbabwensis]|uniref:Uncharacterized protein n=1 Tax=Trichinella zimbabwensis TaxID=268475 RepID=A0A0V1HS93_9BILA|nr:hypothetical protein T11_1615 [Trichinella zimbabwensis]